MTEEEFEAFKLRHSLICESIIKSHDFDLNVINKKVDEILRSKKR
jgi:hypothetical protein